MIFDGDCGFCRFWVARWRLRLEGRVDFEPSQTAAARFPEIPAEAFARAVQLVLPTGEFFEGAEAVFRALALGGKRWPFWMYAHLAGFRDATDLAYEGIANHRDIAARTTHWIWGTDPRPSTYERSSALFVRVLGLLYIVAFVSLWVQIHGLIGARGILPIGKFLEWAQSRVPGPSRFWLLPTLSWLDPSDRFLDVLCGAGTAASLAVTAGMAPPLLLGIAWVLYLSLTVSGQTFLEFQWDLLLLETGFLAIFLAPPVFRRWRGSSPPPTRAVRLLLWWLLFRLMLSSGIVKISSGDPTWKNLTALRFHYFTQPLPPWTAWFASQAPAWAQTVSCALLFGIELAAPFLILFPRRVRHAGAAILALLQVAIIATGNYAYFNFLTLALCVLLLDDTAFPARRGAAEEPARALRPAWPRAWIVSMTAVVVIATTVVFTGAFRTPMGWPQPLVAFMRTLAPLRIANGYGLFSVMTTTRPEIVVEGSDDGTRWKAYEFRWKPGDPMRRPSFVAPHQPRLDWQMWFAALGGYEENPWFIQFCARLLDGSRPVSALLAKDPFAGRAPRYVRAIVYDYRFTDRAARSRTGAWWAREPVGLYCPVLSKEMLRSEASSP